MNRQKKRSFHILAFLAILVQGGCTTASVYEPYYDFIRDGRAGDVIAPLTDTLQTNPSAYEALKILGIAQHHNKNFSAADTLLRSYLAQVPDDDEAMLYYAACADSMNDDARAIDAYRRYAASAAEGEKQVGIRIRQLVQRGIRKEVHRLMFYEATLSSAAPIDSTTIAVLSFDNQGDDRTLDPLGRGLAEMMTTDLSKVKAMKVVERLRMQTILDELSLGEMNPGSPQLAPRVGRLSGAQRIIKGTFTQTDDGMMHLDAAVARTTEAEVEAMASAIEPKEQIFRAEKKLVLELLRRLGVPVSETEREAILSVPTENYFAFLRYAQGLECEDRGLFAQASEYFRTALELDPDFAEARDQLDYTDAVSVDQTASGTPSSGDGVLPGKPVSLPVIGGGVKLPASAADADAITGERARSTLTQTTGGYAPGLTNPVIIRRVLPAPPAPPRK